MNANRANALKSTGPRSVEGKSASRFNALACDFPPFVGQDGILRGDWQSPRVPIPNRHAAWQAAPQSHSLFNPAAQLNSVFSLPVHTFAKLPHRPII